MKKILLLFVFILFTVFVTAQNASYKRVSVDSLKALSQVNKKIYIKDTLMLIIPQIETDTTNNKPLLINTVNGEVERTYWSVFLSLIVETDPIFSADSANIIHWSDSLTYVATQYDLTLLPPDTIFMKYCSGCAMVTGWKGLGDTIFIDTSFVNVSLQTLINDTINLVHWTDTVSTIATKNDTAVFLSGCHEKIRSDTVTSCTDGLILKTFDNSNLYSTVDNSWLTYPFAGNVLKSGNNRYFVGAADLTPTGRKTAFMGWVNSTGTDFNHLFADSVNCRFHNGITNDNNFLTLKLSTGLKFSRSQDGTTLYDKFQVDTTGKMFLPATQDVGAAADSVWVRDATNGQFKLVAQNDLDVSASGGLDTSYAHILIIRPNALDTLIPASSCDLVANTTLFPKGSYFHWYKGSYTPTVNLARDSCVHYFDEGAIVTKTTAGAIFDYSTTATYKNDINILGYGKFKHTTNVGEVFTSNTNAKNINIKLEGTLASATNSTTILIGATAQHDFDISIDTIQSAGGYCIFRNNIAVGCDGRIKSRYLKSTANNCLHQAGGNNICEINQIVTTVGYGVYYYRTNSTLTSNYISGSTGGVYCYDDGYGRSVYNLNISYVTKITAAAGTAYIVNFEGIAQNLIMNGGIFKGGVIFDGITQTAGELYTDWVAGNCSVTNNTFSGGIAFLTKKYWWTSGCLNGFTVNGGDVTIINGSTQNYLTYRSGMIISSGTVTIESPMYWTLAGAYDFENCFTLSGTGKLIIKDRLSMNSMYPYQVLIRKTGGTLILDGATFVKSNSRNQFINAPSSAQDISVYSGGVNCNGSVGDLLSAKARKDSVKVTTAGVATAITLNDGGGAEVFSEADVVTYNTTILMAGRIAALINASGTCDITATDNGDGTFNLIADVAGTNYTQASLTNVTNTQLVLNSFLITETVGGSLIESPNVVY